MYIPYFNFKPFYPEISDGPCIIVRILTQVMMSSLDWPPIHVAV